MLSLAINPAVRFPLRMPTSINAETAERRVLGKALAALRRRLGFTQAQAAERAGITTQGWQKREAGDWSFTEAQVEKVSGDLGATPDDLFAERARILGQTPAPPDPRALEIPISGRSSEDVIDLKGLRSTAIGATRIAGDVMAPWGEPGEIVIFDRDRWPRRGTGCVVETRDGQLLVRIYERSDESQVHVRQLNPERVTALPLADVAGVYAIRLRGD